MRRARGTNTLPSRRGTRRKERGEIELERESNVIYIRVYARVCIYIYKRGVVVRPTSTTSDTRMNTREERCRDVAREAAARGGS